MQFLLLNNLHGKFSATYNFFEYFMYWNCRYWILLWFWIKSQVTGFLNKSLRAILFLMAYFTDLIYSNRTYLKSAPFFVGPAAFLKTSALATLFNGHAVGVNAHCHKLGTLRPTRNSHVNFFHPPTWERTRQPRGKLVAKVTKKIAWDKGRKARGNEEVQTWKASEKRSRSQRDSIIESRNRNQIKFRSETMQT